MKVPIYFDKRQRHIEYDKRQLLENESVSVLKEKLLVGNAVCYFERECSNPIYRIGIVKSFWKRRGTDFVVITDICSDLSTFDISVELLEYNFIVGLDMDTIYNFRVEEIEKDVDELKKELKCVKYKLRAMKKLSHFIKRRFKNLVDSLQNEQHIPNQNQN